MWKKQFNFNMKVYFQNWGYCGNCSDPNCEVLIYVMPKGNCGYQFDIGGNKHEIGCIYPKYAKKYDSRELPEDLWFSIQHGCTRGIVPFNKEHTWVIDDLIYESVDKSVVDAYKKVKREIYKVNTLDEFKALYPYIKKSGTVDEDTIYKLFEIHNIPRVKCKNGDEIFVFHKNYILYENLLKVDGLVEKNV